MPPGPPDRQEETPAATPGSRSFGGEAAAAADHEGWMRRALAEAVRGSALGEVPVGAVVACGGELVSTGHNLTYTEGDPSAHAEMVALRRAAQALGHRALLGCTLYVTLEPCAMCAGAIVLARVARVVFGAYDPKAGMCGSLENLVQDPRLNHRVELIGGVLAPECGLQLRHFFRRRRAADPPDGGPE